MARKHALIYVRKDGTKVPVWSSPVGGQLRFTALKRTAMNGKEWWCVYDNEKDAWTDYFFISAMCKTRSACEKMISSALDKKQIPFVPYDDGTFKKGKHGFEVTVSWVVAKTYEVEATNRMEAQKKIQAMVDRGDVCVWSDGFEATDDVAVKVIGEEKKNGEIQYL